MTLLPPHIVNGFATGITRLFAEAAKGQDPDAQRFVARRPYERILTGFLTPVADPEPVEGPEGPGDVRPDESYEQTNLGFEWCLPLNAVSAQSLLSVHVALTTYVRVLPSYEEARANARFRQGAWRVAEVWQRAVLADENTSPFVARVSLAELVRSRTLVVASELEDQLATSWAHGQDAIQSIYPGGRDLELREHDLIDDSAFEAWRRACMAGGQSHRRMWKPVIDVRLLSSPTEEGCARVLVRLVNRSEPATTRTAGFWDPRLYGVSLRCEMPSGVQRDTEFRALPNSYRYDRRVAAIGINCQPRTQRSADSLVLRTETVPVTGGPRIVPREIPEGAPRFDALAASDCGVRILRKILASMREYDLAVWQPTIDELVEPRDRQDAETDRAQFRLEADAFDAGIALLESGGAAARAFQFMNDTMRRLGQGRKRQFEQWHLFQVVFIVAALPALVEGTAAWQEERTNLSLLWFPAGGGKTEAFLGLIVWHAFYDRLRGKSLGVTAFVRYPLRLLTYQQLQRISRALGKAEAVRLENGIPGAPLSVGYLVGESTTPNSIDNERHKKLKDTGVPSDWQRVFHCPSCDARSVKVRYNEALRLIEHYCGSERCPTRGGRLPIYICDDDLYRYLPTVIVSTVDKLAGLGQNRRFSQLFGRVNMYCPDHGAAFAGSNSALCRASADLRAGRQPGQCGGHDVLVGPFEHLAPSLHIQDELHLLRESLATFDSHYETAAMAVQRELGHGGRRWSLVGSTATIEGYREQARHL